ncbi:hypothetical protein ACVBEF_17465 [Glaciimonas sp. GG7]
MPHAISGSPGSPALSHSEFAPCQFTAQEYEDHFNNMKAQPDSMKLATAFVPEGSAAYISYAWLGEKTDALLPRESALVHRLAAEFEGTTKSVKEIDLSDFVTNTKDDWYGVGKFYLPKTSDADECLVRYGCNTSAESGVVKVTVISLFQNGHLIASLKDKNIHTLGVESVPER